MRKMKNFFQHIVPRGDLGLCGTLALAPDKKTAAQRAAFYQAGAFYL